MSVEALSWAFNLAPVPYDTGGKKPKPNPACAAVLQGMANHAGPDGRNAFPSVRTLMRYSRLSERTVRTCVDRLADEKIILPGDPAIVAAYIKRGDKRPEVWDLNMTLIRDDLTEDDIKDLERLFPGLGQRIRDGVQQLHPANEDAPADGVQPLHPANERGATDAERGAAVAPEPSYEPYIEPPHTPSGCVSARDAHAPASTPEEAAVSRDATGPLADHARNSTPALGAADPARLPADWRPSPELLVWAAEKVPGLDVEEETEEFVHYWAVELPARSPKSPRAKKPASWERVDWGRTWQGRMRDQWHRRGLDRRPVAAPAGEVDLFAAVDQEATDAIVEPWLAYWAQRGTVVTPSLRKKLGELVGEALAAGRDAEKIKDALRACKEPFPAPFRWDKAMAGMDPYAGSGGGSGDGLTFRQRDQRDADLMDARGWQRVAERAAAGTLDDPDESFRAIVEGSINKAKRVLAEEEERRSAGGPPPAVSPMQILRGEIAQ